MSKRLGWCFIGAGMIAKAFLRDDPEINLVSVTSARPESAKKFAEEHGGKAYADLNDAINAPGADIVYVATPHPLHLEQALAAINAGKAVLCEKPVTVNGKEFGEMVTAAKRKGVFLAEAMWPRFNPVMKDVLKRIKDGEIGEVRHVTADYLRFVEYGAIDRLFNPALAGGCTLDLGVYPLAMIQSVLGTAKTIEVRGALTESGVDYRASALMSYENGATSYALSGFDSSGTNAAIISGAKGTIEIPEFYCCRTASLSGKEISRRGDKCYGYKYQIEGIEREVAAGLKESPEITLADSAEIMRQCDAIREKLGVKYPFE